MFLLLKLDDDDELALEVDPLHDGLTKASSTSVLLLLTEVPLRSSSLELDLLSPGPLDEARLGKLPDRSLLEADLLDGLLDRDSLEDDPLTEPLDRDPLADLLLASWDNDALLEELLGDLEVLLPGSVLLAELPDDPPGDLLGEALNPDLISLDELPATEPDDLLGDSEDLSLESDICPTPLGDEADLLPEPPEARLDEVLT